MFHLSLYSRDAGDFTEVFCLDHDGNEHVLSRWQRAAQTTAMPLPEPTIQELREDAVDWDIGDLLDKTEHAEAADAPLEVAPPEAAAPPETVHIPEAAVPPHASDQTPARRKAKAAIRTAVAALSRNTYDLQMRYELALQAKNKNTRALELFDKEAKAAGITINELLDRVVADRHHREELMMRVYATQAQALAEIDRSHGDDIDRTATAAISIINDGV